MDDMARPLRIEYEGAVYHIISRGNRGEHIFAEDEDKEYFIERLQNSVEKYKIDLYAGTHYNREIAEMAGGLSPSAVAHQYKRILKRLREERIFLKG